MSGELKLDGRVIGKVVSLEVSTVPLTRMEAERSALELGRNDRSNNYMAMQVDGGWIVKRFPRHIGPVKGRR